MDTRILDLIYGLKLLYWLLNNPHDMPLNKEIKPTTYLIWFGLVYLNLELELNSLLSSVVIKSVQLINDQIILEA